MIGSENAARVPEQTDFVGLLNRWYRKIPHTMLLCIAATYIIGLIAHGFNYTNVLFAHDNSAAWTEPLSLLYGAAGSRWLIGPAAYLFRYVQLPWLEGIVSLLLCGLSAWLVCEVLEIRRTIPVLLICGIIVVSPTLISANQYLSSLHIFMLALLFSCLAVYVFDHWRFGWLWAVFFMILCCGLYSGYICFAPTLFLMRGLLDLLKGEAQLTKRLWLRHLAMAAVLAVSALLSYLIPTLIVRLSNFDISRAELVNTSASNAYDIILTHVKNIIKSFLPNAHLSYFQSEPLLYWLFVIASIASLAVLLYLLVRNAVWKNPLRFSLLLLDMALIPFVIDLISAFYCGGHLLLKFALVSPWLFIIALHEQFSTSVTFSIHWKKLLHTVYSALIILLGVVTIWTGCRLANTAYTKAFTNYQSAVLLVNRIVDRVESLDGYVPGETPVFLVGNTRAHYAPAESGYASVRDITGIGSPFWDTSLTYFIPFMNYLKQLLKVDMVLFSVPQITPYGLDIAEYAQAMHDVDPSVDVQDFIDQYTALDGFPSQNCYFWLNGVLVFDIG